MDIKDNQEKIKGLEKGLGSEQRVDFSNKEERVEHKELPTKESEIVSQELRREIETMELDDNLKKTAEQKAAKIVVLGEKEKLEHLLSIAREKGVIFAVQVAKKMNDPYILDTFHDILAKEGFYKDFIK